MKIQEQLAAHLAKFTSAPFLFVGSGMSRRYMGLETWKVLLERFAKPLPKAFGYYASKADDDLAFLATQLALDFHEVWWTHSDYEKSRIEFESEAVRMDSPLKIEVSEHIRKATIDDLTDDLAAELEVLKKATIDGVITTNWDLLFEHLFPDFQVFIGQDQLIFSNPQSIAEIYKIHGCCTAPNSLILTKDDYQDFNDRNSYLAAKLLTIFVEHPVIFIGYSLSDSNIIGILNAITSCLKTDNLEKLKDRLIFVKRAGGSGDKFYSSVLSCEGKVLAVTVVETDEFVKVFEPLTMNKRKFPAKVLRSLKNHVYDLVKSNDPQGQMYVQGIDDDDDTSQIQVVYGVGIISQIGHVGYKKIRAEDLLDDVVFDRNRFHAEQVVQHTLPEFLKYSKNVPVFRYLRRAGCLDPSKDLVKTLPKNLQEQMKATRKTFSPTGFYLSKKDMVRNWNCGITELRTKAHKQHCLHFIHFIDPSLFVVEELECFLRDNFAEFIKEKDRTQLKKLVCLYDLVKDGPLPNRLAAPYSK